MKAYSRRNHAMRALRPPKPGNTIQYLAQRARALGGPIPGQRKPSHQITHHSIHSCGLSVGLGAFRQSHICIFEQTLREARCTDKIATQDFGDLPLVNSQS